MAESNVLTVSRLGNKTFWTSEASGYTIFPNYDGQASSTSARGERHPSVISYESPATAYHRVYAERARRSSPLGWRKLVLLGCGLLLFCTSRVSCNIVVVQVRCALFYTLCLVRRTFRWRVSQQYNGLSTTINCTRNWDVLYHFYNLVPDLLKSVNRLRLRIVRKKLGSKHLPFKRPPPTRNP